MKEKIRTGASFLLILLLLPYIAVMLSGQGSGYGEEKSEEDCLERWVAELLPGQLSPKDNIEALKAETVILRSNLMYRMQEEGIAPEELSAEKAAQWGMKSCSVSELEAMWGKDCFGEYFAKLEQAAEETKGMVLQYQNQYIDIPYHAVSAGRTRSGRLLGADYTYVKEAECPDDPKAQNYLYVVAMEEEDIPEILGQDDAGYVTELRWQGEIMTGEAYRLKMGLPSCCLSLSESGAEGKRRVAIKGRGHGFGLSMYQADELARGGADFQEILNYFYEGLECITLS